MGRPISKRFIGSPDKSGNQLVLTSVWIDETGLEEGYYITRQSGTRRYVVSNGVKTGIVVLVEGEPSKAGEATLGATTEDGVEYVRTLYNRTIKTYEDNRYTWNIAGTGEAVLPVETYVSPEEQLELIQEVTDADAAGIVELLKDSGLKLMNSDTKVKFDAMPDGQGRQGSVGEGVAEWVSLYGQPDDLATIKGWVDLHVNTELKKQEFIAGIDSAKNANAMESALKAIKVISDDRQKMIADLIASEVDAAIARGEELKTEDYTVISKQVAELADVTTLAKDLLDARNALSGKKFLGVLPIIAALKELLTTEEPEAPEEPEVPEGDDE